MYAYSIPGRDAITLWLGDFGDGNYLPVVDDNITLIEKVVVARMSGRVSKAQDCMTGFVRPR